MDKNRIIELLQKEKALESEGIWLDDVNKFEYSELTSYKILLFDQVFYENRFKYIDLVKNCLAGKINCYAFQWDFFDIYYDDMEIADKWIEKISRSGIDYEIQFYTDSKIKNFCFLLDDQLVFMCDSLDEGLSEKDFYQKLKQVYSKMLEYAESTSVIKNDREVLKFVMIFFTVVASLAYSVLNPTLFNLLWQSTNISKFLNIIKFSGILKYLDPRGF